jgi:hypothetical protein
MAIFQMSHVMLTFGSMIIGLLAGLAGALGGRTDGRGRRPLDGRDSPGAAASALHSLSIATTKGSCWISRFELGYRLAIEPRLPRCVRLDGA